MCHRTLLDSDWKLQKRILGFHPMDFQHTAENIYLVIISILQTYGITQRILSITSNNVLAKLALMPWFLTIISRKMMVISSTNSVHVIS